MLATSLKPAERVIVAADFMPDTDNRGNVRTKVLALADALEGTGVTLKVNSVLRACGYALIGEIKSRGLKVFADLKLSDIPETLVIDAAFLRQAAPDFVTVMCSTGNASIEALSNFLPITEVLGVTVLTSMDDGDAPDIFGSNRVELAALRLACLAAKSGVDGLVSSPAELRLFKEKLNKYGLSYNTPGIRPKWSVVKGDDQNLDRVMTPAKAIAAGATRIIIGPPITRAENPRDAVLRTIDELAQAH